jgi:endonuclease/exonuclease/phosphatase family metal-dependent hydrolase
MTWGNRYPRIVTWARFQDRATSQTFAAFNTHWDHESQPAREHGARLMRQKMGQVRDHQDALLLLGDLNCDENNPAFKKLAGPSPPPPGLPGDLMERGPSPSLDFELLDTFRTIHHSGGAVGTFHAFRGSRDGSKIDFVLVSPLPGDTSHPPGRDASVWAVLDAGIIHTSDAGHYPSDHFPVTATLELRTAAPLAAETFVIDGR